MAMAVPSISDIIDSYGEAQQLVRDLLATPREQGEHVGGRNEPPRHLLVVRSPPVELDARPPAALVMTGGTGRGFGIPHMLAAQITTGDDPRARFFGDLADKRLLRSFPWLDLTAGKAPGTVVMLHEHDSTALGEAEPVGLGD